MESLKKRPNSERSGDVGHWKLSKRQRTRRGRYLNFYSSFIVIVYAIAPCIFWLVCLEQSKTQIAA